MEEEANASVIQFLGGVDEILDIYLLCNKKVDEFLGIYLYIIHKKIWDFTIVLPFFDM